MADVLKELFGTIDYLVFAGMLVISSAIGVWYAYVDRKKTSSQDFLMGGRSLGALPVSMSVLASFLSAITLLGAPAESYRYGTQYAMKMIGMCVMIPITAHLYVPVYYKLGITSAYEYLELRFNKVVRRMGSAVFVTQMIIYIAVVLYAPALALSEVTGIRLTTSVVSIGLVCTFYTSIGGMKAVVWTDVFQTLLMYTGIAVVLVNGINHIGGIQEVWRRAVEGQRVEFFRFEWDPTIRHTFWSVVVGGGITWMSMYAANQAMIQRYLTISTLGGAQKCLWINLPALCLMIGMTSFCGLVVYAYYHTCDPIGAQIVHKPDQVLPRFVMETLGYLPGIPGLFVSGIFSGALSTVSSGVNSLAAVTLEDFIRPSLGKKMTEIWAARISKILALCFGLLSIMLVFVAKQLGGILQAAVTILGVLGGPMLGIFTLGLFFPYANTWGASFGLVSSLIVSIWFGVGSFVSQPYHPEAPMSYQNCTEIITKNIVNNINLNGNITSLEGNLYNEGIFYPYRFSYMWMSTIGVIVVLVVGNAVSLLTGSTKRADDKLLSPLIIWLNKLFPCSMCNRFIMNEKKKDLSPTILSITKTTNFS